MTPFELAQSKQGLASTGGMSAVRDYLKTGGQNLDPATSAWCAAFINSTLQQSGIQGSGSNMARSLLNVGSDATADPHPGDIAVITRGDPNGPSGHTGFFNGYDDNGNVRILGGNTSGDVKESSFPASRLLGIRHVDAGGSESGPFSMAASAGTPGETWDSSTPDAGPIAGAALAGFSALNGGSIFSPAAAPPSADAPTATLPPSVQAPQPTPFDATSFAGLLKRRTL